MAASYTFTTSPVLTPVTVTTSFTPALLFTTVIAPATGAFVTVSDAYFTATRALSSLFAFVTVTYTVPPVAVNKSVFSIVPSLPFSPTVVVANAFSSLIALYIFTISPASKLPTEIVSVSPVFLFSTLIAEVAGAIDGLPAAKAVIDGAVAENIKAELTQIPVKILEFLFFFIIIPPVLIER